MGCQVILLFFYFKPFIESVVNGNVRNFDKSKDNAVLLLFFTAIACSVFGLSIWKNHYWDLLPGTMIVLLTIICLLTLKKIKKAQKFEKENSNPFRSFKKETLQKLLEELISSEIISSNTNLSSFEELIAGNKLENPILYIGKYNGNLTYVYLFLLLKILLKNE